MKSRYPLPKYYVIEPTNKCNFHCSICPNSIASQDEPVGCMSMKLYDSILNQISDSAEVVQLYWMGEPFLNPEIYTLIRWCKERTKSKVIVSTNGSLLTDYAVHRLNEVGLDELIVSVDACDSNTVYDLIRCGGDLDQLNDNLEYLLSNNDRVHVVLQFIDMYVNNAERDCFMKKWAKYDCDLEISCLYTWANQMPSLNLASNNLSPVLGRPRVPCADLWNKMTIHWNGIVSACCFDYENRLFLGDSNEESLFDIWNGEQISRLRDLHMAERYREIALCSCCDAWAEMDEYFEMYHLDRK